VKRGNFESFSYESKVMVIETLTSESLLHEYSTKMRFQAQSSDWLLVELPNENGTRCQPREQGKPHEPLKSLKLEAEEPAVAFTVGPYRISGCAFAWFNGAVVEGPAGLVGEVCLLVKLVRDCGLSGGGDGIDGIDPRGELALEIL
jgi:hypothetical protein